MDKRINHRLPIKIYDEIKKSADANNVTVNAYINDILINHVLNSKRSIEQQADDIIQIARSIKSSNK